MAHSASAGQPQVNTFAKPGARMDRRKLGLALLKVAILGLVLWGIARTVSNARGELNAQQFSWRELDFRYLVVAATVYFVAQLPMAWFWQQALGAFGQPVRFYAAFRAFFIGHLGKYVPGKFLVIVMRSGLVNQDTSNYLTAGITVFVETLTSMACGAMLASTILFFWFPGHIELQLMGMALMVLTAFGTLPPVMRRAVRFMEQQRGVALSDAELSGISFGLMAKGWIAATLMWALTTVSFWWVLRALPGTESLPFDMATLLRLAASVCLAVVAGFVSMIPGGLGIREWVLNQLLVPEYGLVTALIAAIALRLVMLMTEVVGSAILYRCRPRS